MDQVISSYTRAQAIADGELIDVSIVAREAGFRFPAAISRALWADIEAIPEERCWEDVPGRLWDVLWMGACAMRRAGGSTLTYQLILNLEGALYDEGLDGSFYAVKIVCGPGDDLAPVLTFMRPDED
jgi:hypothetical protein